MNHSLSIIFLVFLLATYIRAEYNTRNSISSLSTRTRDALPYHFISPGRAARSLPSSVVDDLNLVDVIILASVDGKLHALNRTTGLTLWSIGDDPESHHSPPAAFDSLVRTQHFSFENSDQELFIIEPQSGDIYVLPPMASPSDPLQKLPLSVPQLVELSPFSFLGDEHRVFVGSKETSMLVIELDTGRVKGTVSSERECFWDDDQAVVDDVGLEESDGSKPKPPRRKLQSREIHIGRTDYHIRIHSHYQGVIQNLHFSSYGPNNIDKEKQSRWKRTPDGVYVQPLSDGQILAFQLNDTEDIQRVSNYEMPIWGQKFRTPIVAVFDVLVTPSRTNPLALLQPHLHLTELFPHGTTTKNMHLYNPPETTHVGLIGDCLFAMSREHFPLVVFDSKPPKSRFIGISEGSGSTASICEGHQCLVGSRRSEMSSQWFLPLLIDSVPHVSQHDPFDRGIENAPPDAEHNESIANVTRPISEWWTYGAASFKKWGIFGGALVVIGMLARSLFGSVNAKSLATRVHSESTAKKATNMGTLNILPPSFPLPSPIQTSSIPLTPAALSAVKETVQSEVNVVPSTPKVKPLSKPTEILLPGSPGDFEEAEESEKEGPSDILRRKGPRRRRRGKKKKSENQGVGVDVEDDEGQSPLAKDAVAEVAVEPVTPNNPSYVLSTSSLVVSDNVLGFGSHGTVVYEGSLQGRAVAVKRLLQDFVIIAAREVELLQESDDHPNVIRYFYKESKDGFLYIALELCPASLADVIERPDSFSTIANSFDPKRALSQVTAGLRHLHILKIVHRDIKPQNILISQPKNGQYRMLISDFGLCKKLDLDQTSFLPTVHGAMAAGTVGWRAPEILRGEVKLDEQPMDRDESSTGSSASVHPSSPTGGRQPTRLTRSVDVFALGCLFYYTLSRGSHPFGDRFEREVNILKGQMSLNGLEQFGEEGVEATHLISKMLDQEARARPDTTTCLIHPFFWTPARRLNFLQDASDRFEIMCREPREPPLVTLETGAYDVVGNDWYNRLDRVFIENLGKFRKYDGRSVQDLLRAFRNKKHHYQDLPENVKRHLGPLPEGFLGYFTRRFPELILHVHGVILSCGLGHEAMFRQYFELLDT